MCIWFLRRLCGFLRLSFWLTLYFLICGLVHVFLSLLVKFQFLVAILLVLLSDKMHIHTSLLIYEAQ